MVVVEHIARNDDDGGGGETDLDTAPNYDCKGGRNAPSFRLYSQDSGLCDFCVTWWGPCARLALLPCSLACPGTPLPVMTAFYQPSLGLKSLCARIGVVLSQLDKRCND